MPYKDPEKRLEFQQKYQEEHRIEILKYKKEWYLKNRERLLKKRNEYRKNHLKEILSYRLKNKESIKKYQKEYDKKYYFANSVELLISAAKYQKTHRKEINQYRSIKYDNDINFRISCCLRNRIVKVLNGISKSKSTIKLLGCSINELKNHLEKYFTEGMTFENYGLWHIDHIRPCASFDLSKPEEQYKCFHYTNLQPLWAADNLSKNDKV